MLKSIIYKVNEKIDKDKSMKEDDITKLILFFQKIQFFMNDRLLFLKNPPKTIKLNFIDNNNIKKKKVLQVDYKDKLLNNYFFLVSKYINDNDEKSYRILNNKIPYNLNLKDNDNIFMIPKNNSDVKELNVLSLAQQKYTVMSSLNDTVLALKIKIKQKYGIPICQQRITCKGISLCDDKTLADYNLQLDDKFFIVLKLRGGMFHPSSFVNDYDKMINNLSNDDILNDIKNNIDRLNKVTIDKINGDISELIQKVID